MEIFISRGLPANNFYRLRSALFPCIEDGRLYKLTALAKILHILNLYPLLTENVKGKGLPYETISFNTNLNRGILATEDFLMHGDIMNLSMTG